MLGGLAIVGGLLAGATVGLWGGADLLPLLVAIAAMAVLGVAADLTTIGPLPRLALQGGTAVAFVALVSDGLDLPTRVMAVAIGAVAVPLAMNATNLVDNADGLAASLSAVTGLTTATLAVTTGIGGSAAVLGVLIAAACLAFLVLRNRPPASMFMGDVGSLGLGFALAAATILLVRDAITGPSSGLIAAVLFPTAWAVQLADLALVAVTRSRRGASPFRGGVDHTSHRLMLLGASPGVMLAGLATLAAALGLAGALVAATQSLSLAIGTVVVVAVGLAGFQVWLAGRTEDRFRPAGSATADARAGAPPSRVEAGRRAIGPARASLTDEDG